MGRRALPKIDPAVDVSNQWKQFEGLTPWDPAALFGRAAPLEIEVGSGKGLFLQNTATAHPEINFLGIEISHKYSRFAAYRCVKRGLTNVRVADADALRVFKELIPDNSLTAVHVYFPDPWWKSRQKKRRVMNAAFAKDIERTLEPGGKLHFWTDVEEYFQSTLILLKDETTLDGPFDVPQKPPENELDYRTHRERRVRLEGDTVYRAEYRKRQPVGMALRNSSK